MSLADPRALAACVRGEMSLATACDVSAAALAAARSLAATCAEHGRDDLARAILEGCTALDEHDAWTWRSLARITLRLGDAAAAHGAAVRAAELARARGVVDADAILIVARASLCAGRREDARAWLASLPPKLPDQDAVALARALTDRLSQ